MLKIVLLMVGLSAFVGCSDKPVPPATPEAEVDTTTSQAANAGTEGDYTHVITAETEYYTNGPQQARPPDGRFTAGMKVELIEKAGSYVLVRSTEGITAYVVAGSVKKIENSEGGL